MYTIGPPAGRPGGRRVRGPRRLQQLQDFQQTTTLPTDYKSPWALIVQKAPTRRLIKQNNRLQDFQQMTRVSTDDEEFQMIH